MSTPYGAAGRGAAGATCRVTVVPCDHLEWQPPQSRPPSASWSAVRKAKGREPESSAGMNSAPQTPQRCGWSDLAGRSERVTLGMRRILYEPLALHERVAAWRGFA